ncbi:MAG: PQQ-binding-like beta-propeller repeat protein, partial [Planctomycetota bacterium]
ERVCYHDGERVVSLHRRTGKPQWRSEPVSRRSPVPACFGPTLVLYEDVVLFAGGRRSMTGLDAGTGKRLWKAPHHRGGHMSPEDLLVVAGLAWSGQIAGGRDSGVFTGRDVHTGKVRNEFKPDVQTYWFHHRCYRCKATERFILSSRTGIEFVDPKTRHWETHHWVRGGCIYGVMPCNGLVYAPPHSCGCYLESKLCGFNALAPASPDASAETPADRRLERGPAFGQADGEAPGAADWPTYRHDGARSGSTPADVPAALKLAWDAEIGGPLSSVVVAEGKAFVASVDAHTLHALDAKTGERAWTFTAGGRIDSPPTIWRGRCLFGCADGWVYCLRASDGVLAWRFLAAANERRHVAYERLQSVWPVHGSVLVQDGVAWFVAGRSMFLDGGLRLYRLDPRTGKMLSVTRLDDEDPESGRNLQVHVKGLTMPVALPDILSSDGRRVYMRSQRFDLEGRRQQIPPLAFHDQVGDDAHLFCQVGFLDDSWFHRSYWLYGRAMGGGYGGWLQAARYAPWGRLLVFDADRVYGYGRRPEYITNSSVFEYLLYAAARQMDPAAIQRVRKSVGRINARSRRRNGNASDWRLRSAFPLEQLSAVNFHWTQDQPSVVVRAMVKAGDMLFVAGPPDVVDQRRSFRLPDDPKMQAALRRQRQAWEGKLGARLWAVSAADGQPQGRWKLDALPVFDGMAAAGGRLYLAAADGRVLCLAGDGATALAVADEPLHTRSDEPPLEEGYLRPPEVRKDEDFDRVVACAVLEGKQGYRLRGTTPNRFGYAVNKLDKPLTGRAELQAKVRVVPGSDRGFLINGFLAFGDGGKDAQLVKCGVRFHAKSALIIQGPLEGGKQKGRALEVGTSEVVPVTVVVDLDAQKVTLTAKKTTVQAPLARPLRAITHVGYAVDRAYT